MVEGEKGQNAHERARAKRRAVRKVGVVEKEGRRKRASDGE